MHDVPSEEALADASDASDSEKAFSYHVAELFRTPGVQTVLVSKLSICAAAGLMLGMAPQFALDPFGLTAVQSGLLMGYVGVVQLAAQASSGWFQDQVNNMELVRRGQLSPSAMAAA